VLVIVSKLDLLNLLQANVISEHLGFEVAENFMFLVEAELILGGISVVSHDVVVKVYCFAAHNSHKVLEYSRRLGLDL
jgi:hypothetical protein